MKKWESLAIAFAIIVPLLIPLKTSANESVCYLSDEQIEYCKLMEERYNISAPLIASIIQAESSGNPTAKNGPCYGLMGVNWNLWAGSDDDPNSEFSQIELGTWVLVQYREQYGDDLYSVLAHYHGETNIDINRPSSYVLKVVNTAQKISEEWYGK